MSVWECEKMYTIKYDITQSCAQYGNLLFWLKWNHKNKQKNKTKFDFITKLLSFTIEMHCEFGSSMSNHLVYWKTTIINIDWFLAKDGLNDTIIVSY